MWGERGWEVADAAAEAEQKHHIISRWKNVKTAKKIFSGKEKKVAGFSPYLVKVSEDTV